MRAVERPTKSILYGCGFCAGPRVAYRGDSRGLDPGSGHLAVLLVAEKRYDGSCCFSMLGAVLAIASDDAEKLHAIGGDFVPISYNGGGEFLHREQRECRGDSRAASGMGVGGIGCSTTEGRESRALRPSPCSFTGRLLSTYRNEPLNYMGLLAAKTAQFWRGDEIERNQEMYYWRKYSSVLAGTLWKWGVAFPFGLVSPLALLGLDIVHPAAGHYTASAFRPWL